MLSTVTCVPYRDGARTVWPAGQFETWLWDTEISLLKDEGQQFEVLDSYCYTKVPILAGWAAWVLSITGSSGEAISPVVRTWAKHCGRALVGRLSLRCPSWEQYGTNPGCETGISHMTDAQTGVTHRLMHVGGQTLIETARAEGKDSLPQVTGWIMAECRRRLWKAMRGAGLGHLAHVDTDSVLVDTDGLKGLREVLGAAFGTHWAIKGSYRRLVVYGPRNYRAGDQRKTAGVPKKAKEILPNVFTGERWSGVAADIEAGRHDKVTITADKWEVKTPDPRRYDDPRGSGFTVPVYVGTETSSLSSASAVTGTGA